MTQALLVGLACAAIAALAAIAASWRRRRRSRDLAYWTEPESRELPERLDLGLLRLAPPLRGRILAVLFTHPGCGGCGPLQRRVEALDRTDVAVVDVSRDAAHVRACGIVSVPTLVLVGSDARVVRAWVGAPLAGAVEDTVDRAVRDDLTT